MINKRFSGKKNIPQLNESLIPWYVNGTLTENEMDRVTNDVDTQVPLAEQVNQEIQLAKQWRKDPNGLDELLLSEEIACQQLIAKLPSNKASARKWMYGFYTAVALVVGVAIVGFYALISPSKNNVEYQTLTTAIGGSNGIVLKVIFQPTTTEREMRTLMLDGDARLLSGPTANGVYELALPANINGSHYAEHLKLHPAILWAELEAKTQ